MTSKPGDPCTAGPCGRTDTHPYAVGPRCDGHAPWVRAGLPDPASARYCPPSICYCGQCGRVNVVAPITETVIDRDAIRSGKRRAAPEDYRQARDTPRRRT